MEEEMEVVETEQVESVPEAQETEPEAKELMLKPAEPEKRPLSIWQDPDNFVEAMRMAKVLASAPMVPQNYKGQPGNCLIALDMAQRMNMPPLMIMQNLYIVNGNPGWSGQACIALVNNHGRFTDLKFDEKMTEDGDFACTAYATEKKTGEVVRGTTITRQMAKDCGWLDKNGSYWKKMPAQMARYRAAAFFARAYCPEALMGLYTSDDIHGYEQGGENG